MNQFVATAVAEKVAVMDGAQFFRARRGRADLGKFDALMKRKGGVAPREGNEA